MAQKDKTLEILTHILGLLTGFIGPLIILLITKDEQAKVHSRNALNWQISFIIYLIVSFILMLILIGFVLLIALSVVNVVFCILAAVKANEGEVWKYPMAIPFLK